MANMPGYRRGTLRMPFETLWQKRIANSATENTWIVAEADGRVVGNGVLMPRANPRLAHIGEIVMGVDDGFVGRGIGSAILAALLEVADNWRALKGVTSPFAQNCTLRRADPIPSHIRDTAG